MELTAQNSIGPTEPVDNAYYRDDFRVWWHWPLSREERNEYWHFALHRIVDLVNQIYVFLYFWHTKAVSF